MWTRLLTTMLLCVGVFGHSMSAHHRSEVQHLHLRGHYNATQGTQGTGFLQQAAPYPKGTIHHLPHPRPGWFDNWVLVPSKTVWRTSNRTLLYKNNEVRLKGVNWNGIESDCRVPHGLWKNPLSFYLDVLRDNEFNAVRIPLSYEIMADTKVPVNRDCIGADETLSSQTDLTVHDFLRLFLDMAWERGIVIVMDLHTIGGEITPYPWTEKVTQDDVIRTWGDFAAQFAYHPSIMGFEIKNEPHGDITLKQFEEHCTRVIWQIMQTAPNYQGLFFIGGVQVKPSVPWGGSFGNSRDLGTTLEHVNHPSILCTINATDRMIFSPHIYGVDVRGPGVADEAWDIMDQRFGFIWDLKNHWNQSVIVPTEFGGFMKEGSPDLDYFNRWKDYMLNKRKMVTGSFFWTLPPTSKDTGGLIVGDSWRDLDPVKMEFLGSLQPNPTIFKK